jgi:hypothetical protein
MVLKIKQKLYKHKVSHRCLYCNKSTKPLFEIDLYVPHKYNCQHWYHYHLECLKDVLINPEKYAHNISTLDITRAIVNYFKYNVGSFARDIEEEQKQREEQQREREQKIAEIEKLSLDFFLNQATGRIQIKENT